MRSGFSGGGWESCFGQSSVPLSVSVLFAHALCFFCPSSLASWSLSPSPLLHISTCFAGTWQDRILSSLAFPPFHLLERRAKRGWGIESLWRKVFGGRFWIMFTRHKLLTVWTWHVVNEIYFHDDYFYTPTIREPTAQYHRRKKKRVFLPIRYTLCNILAVHTNKAMREKIMTRYQPSSGIANSHSSLTKCPVELSSVSAPNLRLRTSSDRMLSTAQCCGKCNIWWLSEIQRVGQVRCCSERHFWDAS